MTVQPHSRILDELESILVKAGVDDAAVVARVILDAAAARAEGPSGQYALQMATERAAGKPLGHVTGQVRFMNVDLTSAAGVLAPRAETELLGYTALDLLRGDRAGSKPRLIDLCCGAGNLVCGIATELPALRAWAGDLTEVSVSAARTNVERCGLANRVEVLQGDLFTAFRGLGLEGTIDVVVCNPPYISTGKLAGERKQLLEHEPREAFDGGPYGVSIVQRVTRDALAYLRPGGSLLFEIGIGQERQVARLFDRTSGYETPAAVNDSAGRPRVLSARKRPSPA